MKNKLGIFEYVVKQIFYFIVFYFMFRYTIYSALPGKTPLESHGVLFVIVIVTFVINLLFSMKWGRNSFNAFIIATFPYTVYVALLYYKYIPELYNPIGLVAIGVLGIYNLFIIVAEIYVLATIDPDKRKKSFFRFIHMVVNSIRRIICTAMLMTVMTMVGIACFADTLVPVEEKPAKENDIMKIENSMDENMDSMVKLIPEKWEELSNTEKMNVLQVLVNIESRYLGLDKPIRIATEKLDDHLYGYYRDKDSKIVINVDLLFEDPHEVVRTVTHECRHAAQHSFVRIYEQLGERQQENIYLVRASNLKEEFEHYSKGEDDPEKYYNQTCEIEARYYADQSVNEIYERIDEYLKKNS